MTSATSIHSSLARNFLVCNLLWNPQCFLDLDGLRKRAFMAFMVAKPGHGQKGWGLMMVMPDSMVTANDGDPRIQW